MSGRSRRLASHLPAPVRRALRRTLRRTRQVTSSAPADRRSAFLSRLDRQARVRAERPRLGVRAAIAATPRLVTGLAFEWELTTLGGDDAPALEAQDGSAVDLVLLEWQGGAVPGLDRPAVAQVMSLAAQHGVPVLVWATASAGAPWPDGHAVTGARAIFADDADTAAAWSTRTGRPIEHLGPAAHPRVHSPGRTGPALRRQQATAAVVSVATDLVPLSYLSANRVDVWHTAASSAATRPPTGAPDHALGPAQLDRLAELRTTAVVRRPLDGTRPELGHYRVVTVLDNPLPSGWPLVEATMAGTPLVLDRPSMDQLPPDLRAVHTLAEEQEEIRYDTAARIWQRELSDREGLVAARAARAAHSLVGRAEHLAAAAGITVPGRERTVSVVVPTNRPHELDNVAVNIARQRENDLGNVQVVLVLHGLDVDTDDVRARFTDAGVGDLEIVRADPSLTLGACLNLGVAAADGRYVAKVDDDNFYGRHYLTDLVDAFEHSGAGIVGKWAHYIWLRSSGAVILRSAHSEHRFERLVQGGSIVLDRDVIHELRFADLPRAVDTDILTRAKAAGVQTYSSDRFNFVSIRGADRYTHTWPIADTALMNRAGDLVFFGDPRGHVDL